MNTHFLGMLRLALLLTGLSALVACRHPYPIGTTSLGSPHAPVIDVSSSPTNPPPARPPETPPAPATKQKASVVKARQELLDTDHAFARLAAEKGVANAFYEYAADDATVLPAGELPIKGRDAIKVAMSTSNGTLIWQPSDSQVSGSTDFGYTWGPYFFVPPGGTRPPTPTGHYVTVWRKQSDGAWKFVLEMGNPAPPSRAPQP